MSPEVAQGELVDGRADLYSLGCLLFELTTATTPFDGSSFEILLAHLSQPAPRPSDRRAGVTAVVDRLVGELMEKRPDDRPATADAVVAAIDDALAELALRGSHRRARAGSRALQPLAPVLGRGRRRNTAWAVAVAAAAALSGAGFAGYRLRAGDSQPDARADARINVPEPSETAAGQPVSAAGEPLRRIAHDDGELIIRALVPAAIHAGTEVLTHFEITNKLGGAFPATHVVVTIADPEGGATGLTAVMHGDHPGHYVFRHAFPHAGHYVVRIFPSETEAMSTIELDVAR
jgi:hypothetical protein